MNPYFSIIVASFNNGKYLCDCMDSLIAQTYSNIEIVVVDDASTDNSVDIIRGYIKRDARVKLTINKKNKGVGHTKRVGAMISSGELIGIIDADDNLELNAIEYMINAHQKNPEAGLIYSSLYFCNCKLEVQGINKNIREIPIGETYLTWEQSQSDTISGFRTIKVIHYLKTEGFSSYFKKAVDRDIIFKMEEVSPTVYLDQPLYFYRIHDTNISLNNNAWKAKLWEVRAKERSYKRRLGTDIPNISKQKLLNEYYFVYKQLTKEALLRRNYIIYLKYLIQFLKIYKNPLQSARFFYYTLLKHLNPSKYFNE